jgi:NUMOD3 motif
MPRGSNDKTNLVLLTAKEHFLCHHLLTKIHPSNHKIHHAYWLMLNASSHTQSRDVLVTSSSYAYAKQEISKIQSTRWKLDNPNNYRSNKGINNPMYGVHRFGEDNPFYGKSHSNETKKLIGQKNKNKVRTDEHRKNMSNSWIGRPIIICPHCNKQSVHVGNMNRYHFNNCKFISLK